MLGLLEEWVRGEGFYRNLQTSWAYSKVSTFLEDGWASQSEYTSIKAGATISLDEMGRLINKIVSGTSPDTVSGPHRPYVGAGTYPTKLDMAAFVFYENCIE